MNNSSQGKYALITGATSGFGYEFAKLFAKDGYNLVLVARMEDRLEEVGNEMRSLGVEVKTINADLFTHEAAGNIYNEVKSVGITVDVLVNNAGQGEYGTFVETDLKRQLDIIHLNVNSLVALTHYFLKDMVARGSGKVLQLGSVFSKTPAPLMSVYAATKAFVLSFSQALTNELKDTGVTMTVLMPGASDTDFFHKAGSEDSVVYRETSLSDPADVAKDGYDALMSGDSSITSGFKNKVQSVMMNVSPEQMNASMARKQNEPSDETDGRTHTDHEASQKERQDIGKSEGDI